MSIQTNRRTILTGLPAAVGLSACGVQPSSRTPWAYDPSNAQNLIDTYAKVIGAIDERQIYLQYYGRIYAVIPGEVQVPLFQLKGLVRQRWTPNPEDNTYTYSNYDHGLFCDWDTGDVLTSFKNPFTGEINDPLHYNSGEIKSTIGLGEGQENPADKDWRVTGNQVSISSKKIGREFNNPVQPDIYPKASTGKKVQYSWTSTYFADAREIADPTLKTVEADHIWEFLTNYPAWMKVGNKPGFVFWRWAGKKFSDESQIDPYILSEIEKRKPGFLTVEKPWPKRSDGWTQYARERQANK